MKTYVSTRGQQGPVGFYQAILQGIASDGGLLVPDFELPKLDLSYLQTLDYVSLSGEIISAFAPSEDKALIFEACRKAYGSLLFPREVVPVERLEDGTYIAELFHGQTAAFKDLALSLLPHLMTLSLRKTGESRRATILVATSGDTGKAALEGFKDVEGTSIIVFYPTDGVSAVQRQQMVSQKGSNVTVVGIEGNFDDAQRAVKAAFDSREIALGCEEGGVFLSSANSINIARLLPQIVYYVWSYLTLCRRGALKLGEKINFCVPSGNFGNCLAGWLAGKMGVPVGRFIVASNRNNILSDFFTTGVYDTHRPFYKTNAPAMDILVSSNLERLLWFLQGRDSSATGALMNSLKEEGVYGIDKGLLQEIKSTFWASYLTEAEVLETIRECYKEQDGYLLDTHSACAYGTLKRYRSETYDTTPTVMMSTASPYKFPDAVYSALTGESLEPYTAIEKLFEYSSVPVPEPLRAIKDRPVLHTRVIAKDDIQAFIAEAVKNGGKL